MEVHVYFYHVGAVPDNDVGAVPNTDIDRDSADDETCFANVRDETAQSGSALEAPGFALEAPGFALEAPGFALEEPGSARREPGLELQFESAQDGNMAHSVREIAEVDGGGQGGDDDAPAAVDGQDDDEYGEEFEALFVSAMRMLVTQVDCESKLLAMSNAISQGVSWTTVLRSMTVGHEEEVESDASTELRVREMRVIMDRIWSTPVATQAQMLVLMARHLKHGVTWADILAMMW
jgi:hypothetical protein